MAPVVAGKVLGDAAAVHLLANVFCLQPHACLLSGPGRSKAWHNQLMVPYIYIASCMPFTVSSGMHVLDAQPVNPHTYLALHISASPPEDSNALHELLYAWMDGNVPCC